MDNNLKLLTSSKSAKEQKAGRFFSKALVYLFLIVMSIIIIFPFYWMIITALKSDTEVTLIRPTYFPEQIQWSNFSRAMSLEHTFWGNWMLNTVIVGVISTIISVIFTVLAAYAFSRLKFKGRELVFTILLSTMMIPGEMFTVSNWQTISQMGARDSYFALIVPFLASVFYIYLLRNNFKQIPNELYYAAKVDGTSDMKYLLKVMVPLSMPSIISIIILKMMGSWNSYIWPELVCDSDIMRLISNGLRTAFTDTIAGQTQQNLQMAAALIVSIPLFVIFVIFRKYIMRGVSRSGIKG